MVLYNTLTRKKEEFIPLEPGKVRLYACGPTVYNLIHLGNARPLCVFDTLYRYLTWRGYAVTFVQNFTDIDDKIIRRSAEQGVAWRDLADNYIREYQTDATGLGLRGITIHPRATDAIADIIEMIGQLIQKDLAYVVPSGDVYFRARRFDEYGKLSHQPLDDLEEGARIDVSEDKQDALDFALWKAAKPDEPSWETPWGAGRPGWHIECSAMARRFLGETVDIHGGGQDLIFPHHENEIAQSEGCSGKPFARYWMHNGYVNMDNKKMSKSLGNFFTVREIAAAHGYEAIRFFLLSSGYRSPINFTEEVLLAAKASLDRLYACKDALERALPAGTPDNAAFPTALNSRREQFIAAMDDDLNTADALASLFELVRDVNTALNAGLSAGDLSAARTLLAELSEVLGLLYERKAEANPAVDALVEKRQQARRDKNFAEADRIRDELNALGVTVEDTPQGPVWKRG